jgi:hypothetical protein
MHDQIYYGWLQENGKKIKSYRKWQLRHIKLSYASPKRKRKAPQPSERKACRQGWIQGEEWGGTKAKKKKWEGTGIKKYIYSLIFYFLFWELGGAMATTGSPPQICHCM